MPSSASLKRGTFAWAEMVAREHEWYLEQRGRHVVLGSNKHSPGSEEEFDNLHQAIPAILNMEQCVHPFTGDRLPPAVVPPDPVRPPPATVSLAEDWTVERRYLTDDRDQPSMCQHELVVWQGRNGDWYIACVPQGEGTLGRAVRICTSGGAASACPGLPTAIANLYRRLPHAEDPVR